MKDQRTGDDDRGRPAEPTAVGPDPDPEVVRGPGRARGAGPGPGDHARQLAEGSGAAFLYLSMGTTFRQADAMAFKHYRDRLVADCGGPSDPIEVMLIEQLALAHLKAGRLHFRAANAEGLEGARVYGGLAVLLQGELRRTALALKAYRSNARPQGVVAEDIPEVANGAAKQREPGAGPKAHRRRTGKYSVRPE